MISDRLIHMQALRIYLINFCFCSPCNWDLKKKRMKASEYPSLWNYCLVIGGASLYTISVLYRIFTNSAIIFGGHDEEKVYLISKSGKPILATLIFLTIDSLAVAFITNVIGIAILLVERRQMLWRVNNAVLDLNKKMMEQLKQHNGFQPSGQDSSGRVAEMIMVMSAAFSLVLPVFYGLTLLHPYEPVHRTLVEWLEVEPKLSFRFLPLMVMVDWGLLFCGNVVYFLLSIGILYLELCQFWIPGITPRSLVISQGRTLFSTNLGLIDAAHVMKFYRCQQVINVLINDCFKSVWTSMHHGLILIIFVLTTFICVRYTEDVREMGMAGVILPAAGLASMLVEYYETHLLGKILWESRQFIKIGKKVSQRNSVLKRFLMSCSDIQLKTGYPYFVVSYDTFLLILHQAIDFLVSMLVSRE